MFYNLNCVVILKFSSKFLKHRRRKIYCYRFYSWYFFF